MYTVVSWFTPDYAALNERMVASAERFGLECTSYSYSARGNWADNVLIKCEMLLKAFADHDTDILYLDSDAVVNYRPALFDVLPSCYNCAMHWRGGKELLGGTQYFRNCEAVRKLLEHAAVEQQATREWSQKIFARILPNHPDVNVYALPPEYCYIYDSMAAQHPGAVPIIEHFQESRRARKRRVITPPGESEWGFYEKH